MSFLNYISIFLNYISIHLKPLVNVKMCRIVVEGTERGRVEIAHREIILTQAKSLILHWHMCGLYKKTGGRRN